MANSTTPSVSLPPGYSPPLYTITEIDKAGIVVIVTAVCLITAFVSILVRAYVMIQTGTLRLRWDDWAVVVALLLAIIQTSIVQGEAAAGLGRTVRELTDHQSHQIQRLQYADQIFYILSVWVSKLSATLFFYRLSPRMNDRKMSKAVMALVGFTGAAAILSLCFVCAITQPWQYFTSEGVICTSPVSLILLSAPKTSHLTFIEVQQMGGCVCVGYRVGSCAGLHCDKNPLATTNAAFQKAHRWFRLLSTPHSDRPDSCTTLLPVAGIP